MNSNQEKVEQILQDDEDFLSQIKSRKNVGASRRFKTEQVKTKGGNIFLKTALSPDLNKKIAKQVEGSKAYNTLLQNVDWLSAELIVASGEGWLATSWLDEGPIATPEQFYIGQNLAALKTYSKVVAQLDSVAVANLATTIDNQIILGRHSLVPHKYSKSLLEKFEPFRDRKDFNEALVEAGVDYFEKTIETFQPAWQHGDLTPWHIFKDGPKFVLVDCEHVRSAWPRYYDLANYYSQLHVRFGLNEQAAELLEDFNDLSGKNITEDRAFWGLVIVRSLRRAIEHEDHPEMVQRAFKLVDKIIHR